MLRTQIANLLSFVYSKQSKSRCGCLHTFYEIINMSIHTVVTSQHNKFNTNKGKLFLHPDFLCHVL